MKLLSSNEVIDVLVKEFPFLERELQFCCRLELDLEAGEAAEIKLTKKLATNLDPHEGTTDKEEAAVD